MDAATELTWTYLQRPPQPDPPRHRSGNQLLPLPLLLPLRVQGAALPEPQPPYLQRSSSRSTLRCRSEDGNNDPQDPPVDRHRSRCGRRLGPADGLCR
ncbi:hypothetical protein CEE63_16025 [Stenotrophomonas maltophilia]|uniref:Uncharacterized protein n=1 Tax=Stenotrophomonas maltophilia TaxID=40324 RepID=A0A246I152_STEMA|nr:hypothetical protein CEE63_16025 [Stenotrophomonas maltophilia]